MSNWRNDMDNMVVSSKGYTRKELADAFDMIAAADGWKNPIDTSISSIDFDICNEAALFFTGSALVVEGVDGTDLRVTAKGYYLTIGA
mgnify:CR=1 FL=1